MYGYLTRVRTFIYMNVQSFAPRHPLLQKHIAYYYFFRSEDAAFDTLYYAFPHLYTPLNIHRNVTADILPYSTTVYGSAERNYLCLIQGMRELPLRVNLRGRLDKITVSFKPLGINHFISDSFSSIAPLDSQVFNDWKGRAAYHEFIASFYSTDVIEERIDLFEAFLLLLYRPFEKYDLLDKAITLLTDFERNVTIEEVAAEAGLHPRSFNRLFCTHLGISPVGFRKIARFRHSLNNRLYEAQFKRLTDIAYASNFYDQSYFISMYKKMTGSNPKKFFGAIEKIGDKDILFQFIKK